MRPEAPWQAQRCCGVSGKMPENTDKLFVTRNKLLLRRAGAVTICSMMRRSGGVMEGDPVTFLGAREEEVARTLWADDIAPAPPSLMPMAS